jgi:hypothetical protein
MTVPAGYESARKCFDNQGFMVACGAVTTPTPTTVVTKPPSGIIMAAAQTQAPGTSAARRTGIGMQVVCLLGLSLLAALL